MVLLITLPGSTVDSKVGEVVEQASVGAMFSVLFGFVSGEIAWVAAPQFDDEEDPYRVELPAALTAGYGIGVPLGAALGVHLGSLTTSQPSCLWARWAGAEIGSLTGAGLSLLILSGSPADTTPLIDSPAEIVAAALPIALGVGGAFAGDALVRRFGWVNEDSSRIRFGVRFIEDGAGIYCGIRYRF